MHFHGRNLYAMGHFLSMITHYYMYYKKIQRTCIREFRDGKKWKLEIGKINCNTYPNGTELLQTIMQKLEDICVFERSVA